MKNRTKRHINKQNEKKKNRALVYCWVTPNQKKEFKARCAQQGHTMKQALLDVISPHQVHDRE